MLIHVLTSSVGRTQLKYGDFGGRFPGTFLDQSLLMYIGHSTNKGPNAIIMFSEDTYFTPNFFHTELELVVENYSEHYGF